MAVIGPFRKQYYVLSTYFGVQFRYQLPTNGLDAQFQNLEVALQAAKLNQRTRAANFVSMYGGDPRIAHRQGMSLGEDSVYQAMLGQMLFDMNAAKFLQNPPLMSRLIATHPDYLLNYNYWHDNRLGVCACNKCNHMGQNLLGVSLMAVRQRAMEIDNQIDDIDRSGEPAPVIHSETISPSPLEMRRPIIVMSPQENRVTEPNDLRPDFAAPPIDPEIVGYYAVRGEDAIARASSQHTPPGPEFWVDAGRRAGEAYVRLRDQINRDVLEMGVSALVDEADWYEDLPEEEQRDPSDRF